MAWRRCAGKSLRVILSYVANYDMLHNEIMPLELRIGELFADT
jgi:hypothetical protein